MCLSLLVLTDTDYSKTNAYQFLKEVQREIYNEVPKMSHDLESAPNLSSCKDAVMLLMGGGHTTELKKGDKVTKAQDIVDQAKKLMGENVKQMIENQSDFNV